VRSALAYYVSNALKLVLLVATSAANISFGLARGVPLEVSLFVAVVLETGLILALLRAQQGTLHALALLVFGAFIGLVAVETLATLSGLAALPELARIGEALYLLTPALAIAYIVASQLVGQPASTRARIRIRPTPAQDQAAQPEADQVAEQEPAYSLNGHAPK
jgi:alpha/beta superfamily hydrolase